MAVSRLIVDGQTLKNQVVEIEGEKLLRHYPLQVELAFTEWTNDTFQVSNNGTISKKTKDEV